MNLIEMIGGWNEVFGWIGSGILLLSMTRTDMLQLRIFNLLGTAIMTVYTLMIPSWSMLALNLVITWINISHIRRILAGKKNKDTTEVHAQAKEEMKL